MAAKRSRSRSPSASENGPGTPGGGTVRPVTAPTASKTTVSHGLLAGGPQTATAKRPPGRRTLRDLARRALRVEGEHQALPAEDDVVRRIGLVDVVEVELPGRDVVEPAGLGPCGGNRDHLDGEVRDDDGTTGRHLLRRGEAEPAGAAGELEHELARARSGRRSMRSATSAPRASAYGACSAQAGATEFHIPRSRASTSASPGPAAGLRPRIVSDMFDSPSSN